MADKIQGSRIDPNEGDDSGDDEHDDQDTGTGSDGNDDTGGNDDGNDQGDDDKGKGERTFTQAEVDDMIAKRLRREKRKAKGNDAQGDDDKGKGKADDDDAATSRVDERLVKAEARQIARDLGVKRDRIKAVLRFADLKGLDPDDSDDIEDAIAEVLEEYPEWKAEPPKDVRPKARTSGRDDAGDAKSKKIWTRAEIAALSDADYEKNRDEITDQLAKGLIKS